MAFELRYNLSKHLTHLPVKDLSSSASCSCAGWYTQRQEGRVSLGLALFGPAVKLTTAHSDGVTGSFLQSNGGKHYWDTFCNVCTFILCDPFCKYTGRGHSNTSQLNAIQCNTLYIVCCQWLNGSHFGGQTEKRQVERQAIRVLLLLLLLKLIFKMRMSAPTR